MNSSADSAALSKKYFYRDQVSVCLEVMIIQLAMCVVHVISISPVKPRGLLPLPVHQAIVLLDS